MLVHHAHAGRQRRARVARRQRRAIHLDGAGIGNVMAEQDIDQRALASAVLAEQGEHLAALEIERNVVVGGQRAEPLGDMGKTEDGRGNRHLVILCV
ncbi:hypothetical protein D3C87_1558880 [compost metagenome]